MVFLRFAWLNPIVDSAAWDVNVLASLSKEKTLLSAEKRVLEMLYA
jgi:hypothetical protein